LHPEDASGRSAVEMVSDFRAPKTKASGIADGVHNVGLSPGFEFGESGWSGFLAFFLSWDEFRGGLGRLHWRRMEEFCYFLSMITEVITHGGSGHKAFHERNLGGLVIFQDAEDAEDFLGFEMTNMTAQVTG